MSGRYARLAAVTAALDDLVKLLDLEPIEVNIFRGGSPDENRQRVFGGQVAGQALVAAARTVGLTAAGVARPVHSLHAYFLRPGDPQVPILYEVDRIRDGRSFITRRVVAIQHGHAIFNLAASFHVAEMGLQHQMRMPEVPSPSEVPTMRARLADDEELLAMWSERPRPIDLRYVDVHPYERRRRPRRTQRVWLRADGTLPDDPVLHVCIVTYASDITLLDTAVLPHGVSSLGPGVQMASLDHAMWFHRPFRADEWLLYVLTTPSASGGRGLAAGAIFTESGELVVSVMQEGLIRVTP
jgi:acyl-CoA thioesterase-2